MAGGGRGGGGGGVKAILKFNEFSLPAKCELMIRSLRRTAAGMATAIASGRGRETGKQGTANAKESCDQREKVKTERHTEYFQVQAAAATSALR